MADVFELLNCLDTKVVTPEVRNMIKPIAAVSVGNHGGISSPNSISDSVRDEVTPSPVLSVIRSSGWSGMNSRIASIQSAHLLFKDKVVRDFGDLEKRIKDLEGLVKNQNDEIKNQNDEIKNEDNEIKNQNDEIEVLKKQNEHQNGEIELLKREIQCQLMQVARLLMSIIIVTMGKQLWAH